jgi:hypothetical protein
MQPPSDDTLGEALFHPTTPREGRTVVRKAEPINDWEKADQRRRKLFSEVVRVVCRCCGGVVGPLKLDGKCYACGTCGQPLWAYHGPSLKELLEKAGMERAEFDKALEQGRGMAKLMEEIEKRGQ